MFWFFFLLKQKFFHLISVAADIHYILDPTGYRATTGLELRPDIFSLISDPPPE